jgi:hypothetical protein
MAETRLFNAEQAVADMGADGAACNLVILDACRNSPLTGLQATRGVNRQGGLTEMTPPAGSLIAFATDAGQVAFDGDGANGLYTEELLKNVRTPGLTIEQVFKRTRAGVIKRSEGAQVPAEYSRLVGEDIFLAGASLPPVWTAEVESTEAGAVPPRSATSNSEGETAKPPSPSEIRAMADKGDTEGCLQALRSISASIGPGDFAAAPIEILLEQVKLVLKEADAPSPRVIAAASACEEILKTLPEVLPADHSSLKNFQAKAHNRRGDALMLLGRPEEALECFNLAIPFDREDAYILYNRGTAHLALGRREEAKNDFNAAAGPRYKQPKARQLALEALAAMK